jgi:hypothetical protein
MIVRFYSNFRFVPTDISGINGGAFAEGLETLVAHVHEEEHIEFPNPAHPPLEPPCLSEFAAERDYDETWGARYTTIRDVKVVASGGTWKFKIHLAGKDIESGPIAYNATAAEINAALPVEYQPPSSLSVFRATSPPGPGGCGNSFNEEVAPTEWIKAVDKGPGEWEIRIVEAAGTHLPGAGTSWLPINIDLGPVIVEVPAWDEVVYSVELEKGDCTAGAPPPPPGQISPLGGTGGARPHPRPVSGNGQ